MTKFANRVIINQGKRWKYFIVVTQLLLWILDEPAAAMPRSTDFDTNEEAPCPVNCSCLGNVVDCSGLQLVRTPAGLPPWIETLEINDNNIAMVDADALAHLKKLRELDVSANNLDDIGDALSNLRQLRILKMNRNQFTSLPHLTTLRNLTHLFISHNRIESIDGHALLKLPKLQSLDLSGNRINVLQRESFLAPNHLTYLNLNANNITVIENGSLDNLTSLRELRLNKNHLSHLKDLFTTLRNLRILELNKNDLTQIQGLSLNNLRSLEQLRLKRNKIRILDDGAFWPLRNLMLLQLDHNLLTVVKKGGLFGLERLQKFTMSHNHIETIQSQAFSMCLEIIELDLSYNNLTSIDRGTFEYLGKLERLKLDHNKIMTIADGAFANTPNLRKLELNDNQISYMLEDMNGAFAPLVQLDKLGLAENRIKSIGKNAFLGLARLAELDLTGNNVTSIQENAFLPMPNLSKLKMNSGALLCDCALQWLSVWLRKHDYTEARVRCGYPHWLQGTLLIRLHQANFTCDEFPKPRIIGEPASQMAIKGDNVTLMCRATSTADTPLQFTWKHDTVLLKNIEFQDDVSASENGITEASSSLHLINVTHSQAGKYQCMVTNTYGTTYSAKAKINVLIYPSFTKIPKDMPVKAGSTAKLECAAEGLPTPQIAWQKDGGNDFPAARERRMHMMPTDDVFFIVNVKSADAGVYSCTAQNLAGLIVANASLTIFEAPSFVKPMENKEIIAGSPIVLECMASGSPRPKLSWRKNGSPLQPTERHFFTAEDQLLIIVDTVAGDTGRYECEMSSALGNVTGASHLTINPAPSSMVNEDDMLGIIIITVVCCAVGTSVVWVVIIYQTRRRLSINHNSPTQSQIASIPVGADTQTHLYLETSSQHSKDSGTGDSTNPSSDQLQLCLPEEPVACAPNNEETSNANGADPLLRYTNHERLGDVKMV